MQHLVRKMEVIIRSAPLRIKLNTFMMKNCVSSPPTIRICSHCHCMQKGFYFILKLAWICIDKYYFDPLGQAGIENFIVAIDLDVAYCLVSWNHFCRISINVQQDFLSIWLISSRIFIQRFFIKRNTFNHVNHTYYLLMILNLIKQF